MRINHLELKKTTQESLLKLYLPELPSCSHLLLKHLRLWRLVQLRNKGLDLRDLDLTTKEWWRLFLERLKQISSRPAQLEFDLFLLNLDLVKKPV